MSADNWVTCPKCNAVAIAAHEKLKRNAENSYGRVSSELYMQALAKANEPLEIDRTFREDYEIGVDCTGEFEVIYRGGCERCGLTHEYRFKQQILSTKLGKTGGAG